MKKTSQKYGSIGTWKTEKNLTRHCEEQSEEVILHTKCACHTTLDAVSRRSMFGFTLIEMIITIALIVILSTISVPIYKDYLWKTKMAEGYALIAKIRDAQFSYYNEYGNFLTEHNSSGKGSTCNEEVLGIDARGNKYFTLFCIGSANKYFFAITAISKDAGNMYIYYNKTSGFTYK